MDQPEVPQLSALMFTEPVNYTDLMEKDEREALKAIEHQPAQVVQEKYEQLTTSLSGVSGG